MPTKDELERQLAALREENASLVSAREQIWEMQRREQELDAREQRVRQREAQQQQEGAGVAAGGVDQLDLATALLSLGEAARAQTQSLMSMQQQTNDADQQSEIEDDYNVTESMSESENECDGSVNQSVNSARKVEGVQSETVKENEEILTEVAADTQTSCKKGVDERSLDSMPLVNINEKLLVGGTGKSEGEEMDEQEYISGKLANIMKEIQELKEKFDEKFDEEREERIGKMIGEKREGMGWDGGSQAEEEEKSMRKETGILELKKRVKESDESDKRGNTKVTGVDLE
ncbi:hypothetical protein QAD02_021185 [Eretmocerus hayati]|uniref:Uncharacterized protein n=1 Tax=Eretmocerus hayati TaxID=131215 RepID=A0ACC2PSP3_9HYME|nr:hypothetical protein QAD02_021185 [Eretmocerus hayati]